MYFFYCFEIRKGLFMPTLHTISSVTHQVKSRAAWLPWKTPTQKNEMLICRQSILNNPMQVFLNLGTGLDNVLGSLALVLGEVLAEELAKLDDLV